LTVATAALLVLHVGVFDATTSPFELVSRAVAVIVWPTCNVGDGAMTTIAVTVVGDGAVGPSLQAATAAHITIRGKTLFMSTLLAREKRRRSRHRESIS
jgi:hypothetical protein